MNYICLSLKEAKKAYKLNEIPVGAVIVKNGKIIAKSHNFKQKKHNILGHAEVICIKKASKKLKTWNLCNCDIFVTMKPCSLCQKVIEHSRIDNIYYLVDKSEEKCEYNRTNVHKVVNFNRTEEEYKNLLRLFFKNKRK